MAPRSTKSGKRGRTSARTATASRRKPKPMARNKRRIAA